ncbi:MAG: ABC transporter ATP-binding protein [Candidatus Nanopelagicales bacterium]
MSELRLTDVGVRYGDRVAVAGIDVVVAPGEVVAVLGPSGCGKSTLLRAITGLEPLSAGSVHLGGVDLAGVPTHRRGIGLMFQEAALFEHLDVSGNVGFGLRMQHRGKAEIAQQVARMLHLVGLADRAHAPVDELSGGERQRVSLARTLAPEPGVVLLDEPLGALDRALRRDMVALLSEAFAATSATVMYVTHDRDEAFALADRVALMRDGRWVQVGSVFDVIENPADGWVRDFLA